MDDDFNELQRMLRLKRYEAPPAEYFEDFLFDFHRRQREELLRRPLWRLALDRLEGALPTFTPARYAYVGSCAAAVVVAAVTSGHILTGHSQTGGGVQVAKVSLVPKDKLGQPKVLAASNSPRLDLHGSRSVARLPELNFDQPRVYTASTRNARPRYVLDTQPVSYEQPSSF